MTINRRRVEGGTYPSNNKGLELWDENIQTLPEALAMINVAGILYVSNNGLEALGKLYPELLIKTARTDAALELVVLEKSTQGDEFSDAINAGGYGLQNQERVTYLEWIWREQEGNPGGH